MSIQTNICTFFFFVVVFVSGSLLLALIIYSEKDNPIMYVVLARMFFSCRNLAIEHDWQFCVFCLIFWSAILEK